jgi:hypothetical protein
MKELRMKTYLDSGTLTSTMQNEHFVSHGLMCDFANASTTKKLKNS